MQQEIRSVFLKAREVTCAHRTTNVQITRLGATTPRKKWGQKRRPHLLRGVEPGGGRLRRRHTSCRCRRRGRRRRSSRGPSGGGRSSRGSRALPPLLLLPLTLLLLGIGCGGSGSGGGGGRGAGTRARGGRRGGVLQSLRLGYPPLKLGRIHAAAGWGPRGVYSGILLPGAKISAWGGRRCWRRSSVARGPRCCRWHDALRA